MPPCIRSLAQSLLVEAGQEVHIKAGNKIVLEAGSELTLKVGGSFVKVDPSGVTLVGPTIKMNSGGSPGSGSGWAGQMPGLPGAVKVPPRTTSDHPGECDSKEHGVYGPAGEALPLCPGR